MGGTKRKRAAKPSSPQSVISVSSDSDDEYQPKRERVDSPASSDPFGSPEELEAGSSQLPQKEVGHAFAGNDPSQPIDLDNFDEDSLGPPNPQTAEDKEPPLCKEQQDIIDLILSGRNVFYTGSAGCGKSTVLKALIKRLEERPFHQDGDVHVVAPTGRAALQVDGMSTWSYMGWTPDDHKLDLMELAKKGFRKHVKKRLNRTKILIIDEISMVENHHLERMNEALKTVRHWDPRWKARDPNAPAFGGLQIVVTGDFCQLPPVKPFQHCMYCGLEMTPNTDNTMYDCPNSHGPFLEADKWAFCSAAWEEANFVHVHLKQIHRQNDEKFIKMLQKCRLGLSFTPQEKAVLIDHPCNVQKATKLLCTRKEVSDVNQKNFRNLKTQIYEYRTTDDFTWNRDHHPWLRYYNDRLPDGSLRQLREQRVEPRVALRAGMLVVLQVNLDLRGGLCNGSQGIICGWEPFDPAKLPKAKRKGDDYIPHHTITGDHAELKERQVQKFMLEQKVDAWPRVLFHNGKKRTIYATCMVNSVGDRQPYSLLHRTQVPLMAGWAMSVHKSQGMTLDRVIVDLSRAFEEGQVYVALSRATSLEGLKIEGDAKGLSVGSGGNDEVRTFLEEKFGEQLFLDHR